MQHAFYLAVCHESTTGIHNASNGIQTLGTMGIPLQRTFSLSAWRESMRTTQALGGRFCPSAMDRTSAMNAYLDGCFLRKTYTWLLAMRSCAISTWRAKRNKRKAPEHKGRICLEAEGAKEGAS